MHGTGEGCDTITSGPGAVTTRHDLGKAIGPHSWVHAVKPEHALHQHEY
jgi:hypothetical protein